MTRVESYQTDLLTAPPDVAGMPHLSIPCGYDDEGMPIGMQFVSNQWEEGLLFSIGEDWEKKFDIVKPEVTI